MTREKRDERLALGCMLALMALGYGLLSLLTDGDLFRHEMQDSYTEQALNWFQGRLWLADGERYTWLELAIYDGKYWCSFPPVPAVVMLPFALVFGQATPNNLLVGVYGLISAALAFRLMRTFGRGSWASAFWGAFLVWGSNMLWMTTYGGVWFQAQALCMVFSLGGCLAAAKGKKGLSLFLLALAVGCRPFTAVFLPVFVLCFAWREREQGGFMRALLRQWRCCLGALAVALALMGYNYARFGDPLQFGHDYLPEFTEAEHGQFALCYLWPNLRRILFEPVRIRDGALSFPVFDGFMFYVANPLFLALFYEQIRALVTRRTDLAGTALTVGMTLELLLLCMHKTFGGWQFGCRYTCDLLPFALLYIARKGRPRTGPALWALAALAVAFNVYGVFFMYQWTLR